MRPHDCQKVWLLATADVFGHEEGRPGIRMNAIKWSKIEKDVARGAFETAYQRECGSITAKLKEMIAAASTPALTTRGERSMRNTTTDIRSFCWCLRGS